MTEQANSNFLFVYGTLRQDAGHPMSRTLLEYAAILGPARVPGRLFNLGRYPGMSLSEVSGAAVVGDVYRFVEDRRAEALDRLDDYEGCGPRSNQPHEYRRQLVEVLTDQGATLQAWAYVLNRSTEGLEEIACGDFLAWRDNRGDALGRSKP